ncbi:hypothetical protein HY968_04915 [Candidatus Kaiserbacteria bacterium]|nr:hypothetical protein [Candidatus Kaiserbacteria bacterium]
MTQDSYKGLSIVKGRFLVDGEVVSFEKFCNELIQRQSEFPLGDAKYDRLPEVIKLEARQSQEWLLF